MKLTSVLSVFVPFGGAAGSVPPADLLEAILQRLAADARVAADLPGGVWSEEAPASDDVAMPYCVITTVSEVPEFNSVDSSGSIPYYDRIEYQLAIFAEQTGAEDALDAVRRIGRDIVAALDDAPLVFSTGRLLELRQVNQMNMRDPDPGPSGLPVYQRLLTFDAVVQRSIAS